MAQTKEINYLTESYVYCKHIANNHYENFPVASFFLPKQLRNAIAAIYAFARIADDYADDSNLKPTEKLIALNHLENLLLNIAKAPYALSLSNNEQQISQCQANSTSNNYDGNDNKIFANSKVQAPDERILIALSDTIYKNDLPTVLLLDLLTAFKQDASQNRYNDFGEVLNYCCYSANPIGRLLLHLTKQDTIETLEYSDYICTSLQLINFMQDLYHDLINLDRCYIPLIELTKFKVSIAELKNKQNSANISKLIKYQLDRIYAIYNQGLPLGAQLSGLFGFDVRLIIAGGKQILQALYARKKYYQRPTLTFMNKIQMVMLSLFPNLFSPTQLIMAESND